MVFLSVPAFRTKAASAELHITAELRPNEAVTGETLSRLLPGTRAGSGAMTRAEFAAAVYDFIMDSELELPTRCRGEARDLEECGAQRDAVSYLLQGGVMGTDETGFFHPGRKITGGEAALGALRLQQFSRHWRSGQPASTLPVSAPEPESVFSRCLMLGHSNVVGLDMLAPTKMDIIAKEGVSSFDFLGHDDLSFGLNGSGYAYDGLCLRPYDVVYIMLGTNDMVQGSGFLGLFRQRMGEIIELTAYCQSGAEICLLAISPVGLDEPLFSDEIYMYNCALKELSRANGLDYLDIYTPLATRNGANRPLLARDDGIHYNSSGYKTILNVLLTHFPEVAHEP